MKYLKFLFSPAFMGLLFLLFAVAMGAATFIENDFGSSAAYSMVYNTWWFELILVLLIVNLVGQLIVFKLYRKAKFPTFMFHIAFVFMIIGAGITRYFGWEGTMHIREGEEQRDCFSNEKYISYNVTDKSGNVVGSHSDSYSMTSVSADDYKKRITIGSQNYELVLARIIPNAAEELTEGADGEPVVSFLISKERMPGETIILKEGDIKTSGGLSFSFDNSRPAEINISVDSGGFYIYSKTELGETSMGSQASTSIEPGTGLRLRRMQIITVDNIKVIPQELLRNGVVNAVAVDPSEQYTGQNAFIFHLFDGNRSETVYLWNRDTERIASGRCGIDDYSVEISYGSLLTTLPFSIKLTDFILDRYPGSNSPSGYKSDVILLDKTNNVEKPFMIFMNNILKYKGYRFYQSSYDPDEKGTISIS